MSASRNRPSACFGVAEQRRGNGRFCPRHLLYDIPHTANFSRVKPCSHILALLLCLLFCSVPAIVYAAGDYWAPWVTKTTTNSATINWRGTSEETGTVEYATEAYYNLHKKFNKTTTSLIQSSYQHVPLTGLAPGTAYVYKVRPSDNATVFGNRAFRTMPVRGPFTFIVISDSQEGHDYTEAMRFQLVADAIANEKNVLFILHGGDYAGHDSPGLWAKYFEAADKMLAKFAIFTTIGNHEYHSGLTPPPPLAPTAAVQYHSSYDTPLNYSFDCAGIRFIILDSPDPLTGEDPHTSVALAQSQALWLGGLLKDTMAGVFTIHHHPIWDYFNSTNNPDLQTWEDLYHAYNISATFAGHTHNYQRYSVKGIPYFIVGNAGGRFSDLISDNGTPEWYVTGETRQLGYLKVTVDPANNTATATEIFVASVQDDDSAVLPVVHDPLVIGDNVTFPLSTNGAPCPATKVLGAENPALESLRTLRDSTLAQSVLGRRVIQMYYTNADSINAALDRNPALRALARRMLEVIAPLVGKN